MQFKEKLMNETWENDLIMGASFTSLPKIWVSKFFCVGFIFTWF